METLVLSLVIIGVLWYIGAFRTFQRIIATGNRAAAMFDNENKVKVANKLANIELDATLMAKAQANKSLLDGFDL